MARIRKRHTVLTSVGIPCLAAVVLTLATLAGGHVSAQQNPVPPNAKIHRSRAGKPDKDGWYPAQSTDGHFRVKTPVPFMDATFKGKGGRDTDVYVILGKSSEGFTFTVMESFLAERKDDTKANLTRLIETLSKGASIRPTDVRYFEFKGLAAAEFKTPPNSSPSVVRCRYIVLPDRSFTLLLEYPKAKEKEVTPLIQPFFDSLEIQIKK